MSVKDILNKFHDIATSPLKQMQSYKQSGKKIVLVAPVYTPEEIIHSMGLVPMGVWGADIELKESKSYFPAFICSIMQSILELGIKGSYQGASAIVIPSLCDSLKSLGENWKYAVPSIPFIPMSYPQNRKPDYGKAFTKASYERVINDLEKITDCKFDDEKLKDSIKIYNQHNEVMRELEQKLANYKISASDRSDIFKSAFFMLKEEHTELVKQLITAMEEEKEEDTEKIRIFTTGILADSPSLLKIFDEYGMKIVADDVAAQSRQYRTDAVEVGNSLDALAQKFADMDCCSVLYDVDKKRINKIIEDTKKYNAQGILVILTKFCAPEEFDYPLLKKACEKENIPIMLIEVDRQMVNYEQAKTMIETFKNMLEK